MTSTAVPTPLLRVRPWAPALLLLLVPACGEVEREPALPGPEEVVTQLRPPIQLEGLEPQIFTLEERMDHYAVPGVSIAVLDGGEIAWARGWGTADLETGAPVTPETLFQAASISKPVAALAAMSLVEEGVLSLDDPVNDGLTSWTVPDNEFTADSAVTLRGLLSHTAGLTVWGFPGYRKDEPFSGERLVARNVDVLDGRGNTDSVRVYKVPGASWQYSGGGFTVMEQLVEDVTGRSFAAVADDRVLDPVGMTRSTYEQPLPEARWEEAARGHQGDGSEVEGEWHTYPEQAAAGLWTTPTELLLLSAHLVDVLEGSEAEGVVSRETLEVMLTPHRGGEEGFTDYGLGFGADTVGGAATFGHGGANEGFRAQWMVFRDSGDGVAVMTNGERGGALAGEILRALAAVYGWPGPQAEVRAFRDLPAEELEAFVGRYATEAQPSRVLTVRAGDGVLLLDVPDQETFNLRAIPDTTDRFFVETDGQEIEFRRSPDGEVEALTPDGERIFLRMGGG